MTAAAALHLAALPLGAPMYRLMGAGERLAVAVERGEVIPHVLTLGIAGIILVMAAYAFAGAGLIPRLPLLRFGLVATASILMLRGLVLFMPSILRRPDLSSGFIFWSSLIVLAIGLLYVIGIWRSWPQLGVS